MLRFLDGNKFSISKTILPAFNKSTTQKARDRGCVEIVYSSSTFHSTSDSNNGIMIVKAIISLKSHLAPFPTSNAWMPTA